MKTINPRVTTLADIHKRVCALYPRSRRQVLRDLNRAGIRPLTKARMRPQVYAPDAADRIIEYLGLPRQKARAA